MLLALEALPDMRSGIERPFAPEGEAALFSGRQQLQELIVFKGHTGLVWTPLSARRAGVW